MAYTQVHTVTVKVTVKVTVQSAVLCTTLTRAERMSFDVLRNTYQPFNRHIFLFSSRVSFCTPPQISSNRPPSHNLNVSMLTSGCRVCQLKSEISRHKVVSNM